MQWVKMDCQALSHPKLLRAGAEGVVLWVAGLCHCNTHATNGRIDLDMVPLLYPPLGAAKAKRAAKRLCEVGLWHDCGTHFQVHDYEDWQAEAAKEAVEAKREYERSRKQQQRLRGQSPGRVPDIVPDKTSNGVPDVSRTDVPECPGMSPRARTRAGAPASDRPTDRQTDEENGTPSSGVGPTRPNLTLLGESRRVTPELISQEWHRLGWKRIDSLNQPSNVHRESYEVIAASCNATDDPIATLAALLEYFWLAPHGPIASGRITRPNPSVLARHVTDDLANALAWKRGEPPPSASRPPTGHMSEPDVARRPELRPIEPLKKIPREPSEVPR